MLLHPPSLDGDRPRPPGRRQQRHPRARRRQSPRGSGCRPPTAPAASRAHRATRPRRGRRRRRARGVRQRDWPSLDRSTTTPSFSRRSSRARRRRVPAPRSATASTPGPTSPPIGVSAAGVRRRKTSRAGPAMASMTVVTRPARIAPSTSRASRSASRRVSGVARPTDDGERAERRRRTTAGAGCSRRRPVPNRPAAPSARARRVRPADHGTSPGQRVPSRQRRRRPVEQRRDDFGPAQPVRDQSRERAQVAVSSRHALSALSHSSPSNGACHSRHDNSPFGRVRVRGDAETAEARDVLDDVARLPGQPIGRLPEAERDVVAAGRADLDSVDEQDAVDVPRRRRRPRAVAVVREHDEIEACARGRRRATSSGVPAPSETVVCTWIAPRATRADRRPTTRRVRAREAPAPQRPR